MSTAEGAVFWVIRIGLKDKDGGLDGSGTLMVSLRAIEGLENLENNAILIKNLHNSQDYLYFIAFQVKFYHN